MSKIIVNFKNLCALFTKNVNDNELMVGLLDLADFYDVPERHFHYPKITIETEKLIYSPNGENVAVPQCWTYEGFLRPRENCAPANGEAQTMQPHLQHSDNVFGTILLEIPDVAPGLNQVLSQAEKDELAEKINQKRLEMAKRNQTKLKPENGIKVDDFNKVLDIQAELYDGHPQIHVNPQLCKARFYFYHGTLFSILPFDPPQEVIFEPAGSGAPNGEYPSETGLEIEIPQDRYAILRFLHSDARDFVFLYKANQDYYVTIENSPLTQTHDPKDANVAKEHPNHFQFYYKLVETKQKLDPMFLPTEDLATPRPPNTGDPFCMPGGFGGDPPPPLPPPPGE